MSISEKINIVLMFFYVVATIFICYFNYKSAKASKEQIKESQKQFKQINSAQVMITFKSISFGIFGFVISNLGNDYAKNVKIKCSENITNASKNETKSRLELLCKSTFVLAPKQEFILLLFPLEVEELFNHIVDFDIRYESGNEILQSKITIDLSQYAWAGTLKPKQEKLVEETLNFEKDISSKYKKLNDSLIKLNNGLKYLNNSLSDESIEFLKFIKKHYNKKNVNLNCESIIKIKSKPFFSKINNSQSFSNILEELKFYNIITNNSFISSSYITIYFTLDGINYLNKINIQSTK